MTAMSKYALSSLALSAKVHKLLDQMGSFDVNAQDQAFDSELAQALHKIERHNKPLRSEARHLEIQMIRRDFDALEQLWLSYKERLDPIAVQGFEKTFKDIKKKIKEKELMI